ncbi:hypothetical protein C8R44DRAFT_855870 [Mycena epipterygia]|nr:hypothetical protein C8R44DRAFT_855870 [Mycena epipterygia]
MYKVDNFLRESQRMHGIGTHASSIRRSVHSASSTAQQNPSDVKSSNRMGSPRPFPRDDSPEWHLPADDVESAPRPSLYRDPDVFDGFRFAKLRQAEDVGAAKHQAVTISLDYLASDTLS